MALLFSVLSQIEWKHKPVCQVKGTKLNGRMILGKEH